MFVPGPDGKLIYRCSCCPTYFSSQNEVQKHQSDVHRGKLTCKLCYKMFKDPECLGAHVRYTHKERATPPKKYIYVCTKCGMLLIVHYVQIKWQLSSSHNII